MSGMRVRRVLLLPLLWLAPAALALHGALDADIDRSADPCQDFYAYANGAWRQANPIPPEMDRWSRRWQAGEQAKDRLADLMREAAAERNAAPGTATRLLGDFRQACLDEATVEARGLAPLQPWLARIDAVDGPAALQAMVAELQGIGIEVPFALGAQPDPHQPDWVLADIAAAGLGMPDRDYYLKSEPRFEQTRAQYRQHVQTMLALSGWEAVRAEQGAQAVVAFETRLAAATLDNVAARDPAALDHPVTLAELGRLMPHFDWPQYFKLRGIAAAVRLNDEQPRFLAAVDLEFARAPLDDWKAYLRWQLVQGLASALPAAFVSEDFAFYGHYLGGATKPKPRERRCAETADRLFGDALGERYVQRHFPPEAKARTQEMVRNLLAAMRDTLLSRTWMSDATKERALAKIATFNPKIGYPDHWKDYAEVRFEPTDLFGAVIAGRRFVERDERATLGKPVDRRRWDMSAATSDAYYNPLLNEIVFPAAFLQPPAFDPQASEAVNYGAIGVVIGHEISHGFDDQGARFDFLGRLRNWWTDADLDAFKRRAACVADQFEHYEIEPGIHHIGGLVLGESIADLGGLRLAWRAFGIARAHGTAAPDLDGFTPEQQFFLGWGQFRGDAVRPETQRKMLQSDPHPVARFRVIGPLSNLPEFRASWACAADAPMVRPADRRCEVW